VSTKEVAPRRVNRKTLEAIRMEANRMGKYDAATGDEVIQLLEHIDLIERLLAESYARCRKECGRPPELLRVPGGYTIGCTNCDGPPLIIYREAHEALSAWNAKNREGE
jgi:hypothetical protein